MSVLVVGSVALDSVETPFGKADDVLGGSATFFSASASQLTKVSVVGVIGNDYPVDKLQPLKQRGVDFSGLEQAEGLPSAGAAATLTTSIRPRRWKRISAYSRISAPRFPKL